MAWDRAAVACIALLAGGIACTRAPTGSRAGDGGPRELKRPRPIATAPTAGGCIADTLGEVHEDSRIESVACDIGDEECIRACQRGDAVACFIRALDRQRAGHDADQAAALFRRSCELGLAIGCTNHGADLWGSDDAEKQRCARRLFERTCAVEEEWGCGMLGRMILDAEDAGPDDVRKGRAILEHACEKIGGFACRVLALELEKGRLGPYTRTRIRTLLARACNTGDEDSCHAPKSASATFHPVADKP